MKVSVSIQHLPFDPSQEWAAFVLDIDGASGGVAGYCGLVRDRFGDRPVTGISLEHYPGMTERSIERIVEQATERWQLEAVHVVHRVGDVGPREPIVLVLVASAHREAAFAACEFVMDMLKTDAVFWKKERSGDGGRWVESTSRDLERAAGWRSENESG